MSSYAPAKTLSCESLKKVEGWDGGNTNEKVQFLSKVNGKTLVGPELNGAYKASLNGDLFGTKSTNGKWVKYKYLEDAWCWFSVSLPLEFDKTSKFTGFVDVQCEGYSIASVRNSVQMICQLKE